MVFHDPLADAQPDAGSRVLLPGMQALEDRENALVVLRLDPDPVVADAENVAVAVALGALQRTESRGAHSREDHPQRNDDQWLRHTLYFRENDQLDYKPVRLNPLTVDTFQPKERTY